MSFRLWCLYRLEGHALAAAKLVEAAVAIAGWVISVGETRYND